MAIANSVAFVQTGIECSGYTAYLARLNRLLADVVVTTGNEERLSPETGMAKALEILLAVKDRNSKVMIIGNGGSAAIASHQALDLWKAGGIPAIAFNDAAQITCLGNDFGYEYVFSKAIKMQAQPQDVLIAISSSGRSPNILNAVHEAKKHNCIVITYAGFSQEAHLISLGDLNFYIDSNQYGLVEVAHMALIHYLTDMICEKQKQQGEAP